MFSVELLLFYKLGLYWSNPLCSLVFFLTLGFWETRINERILKRFHESDMNKNIPYYALIIIKINVPSLLLIILVLKKHLNHFLFHFYEMENFILFLVKQ